MGEAKMDEMRLLTAGERPPVLLRELYVSGLALLSTAEGDTYTILPGRRRLRQVSPEQYANGMPPTTILKEVRNPYFTARGFSSIDEAVGFAGTLTYWTRELAKARERWCESDCRVGRGRRERVCAGCGLSSVAPYGG